MTVQVDWGAASIAITILGSVIAMAVAWGTLRERVKNICGIIESEQKCNREDHQRIFEKLDKILEVK